MCLCVYVHVCTPVCVYMHKNKRKEAETKLACMLSQHVTLCYITKQQEGPCHPPADSGTPASRVIVKCTATCFFILSILKSFIIATD